MNTLEPGTKYTWIPGTDTYRPLTAEEARIAYPEQREDDMGETSIHFKLIADFLNILRLFFKDRKDVFLSANLNVYFVEGNPDKWLAPDILVAFGVPSGERTSYKLWEEGRFPQVIIEVASERSWKKDVADKMELYDELGAEEYYILDPKFEFLPAPMLAFRRQGGRLIAVPADNDRMHSEHLGLDIVRDVSGYRLFDPEAGQFLLTLAESEERRREAENLNDTLQAEIERLRGKQ